MKRSKIVKKYKGVFSYLEVEVYNPFFMNGKSCGYFVHTVENNKNYVEEVDFATFEVLRKYFKSSKGFIKILRHFKPWDTAVLDESGCWVDAY